MWWKCDDRRHRPSGKWWRCERRWPSTPPYRSGHWWGPTRRWTGLWRRPESSWERERERRERRVRERKKHQLIRTGNAAGSCETKIFGNKKQTRWRNLHRIKKFIKLNILTKYKRKLTDCLNLWFQVLSDFFSRFSERKLFRTFFVVSKSLIY